MMVMKPPSSTLRKASEIDEDTAPDTSIDEKVEAELDAAGDTNLLDETRPVE